MVSEPQLIASLFSVGAILVGMVMWIAKRPSGADVRAEIDRALKPLRDDMREMRSDIREIRNTMRRTPV